MSAREEIMRGTVNAAGSPRAQRNNAHTLNTSVRGPVVPAAGRETRLANSEGSPSRAGVRSHNNGSLTGAAATLKRQATSA